ncbi:MAG: elongation factor G [Acidimicrobiia bacterium]|nr:elongation factor G [Acidimicrobiia bacterium]
MTPTNRLRNVVLVGHQSTGKTSLAEALLYRAGAVSRLGRVDDGSTQLDHDPEARARTQTLSLSVTSCDWGDHRINLIDTPGYTDFLGDALMGLQVADLAVFVVDGVAGVQAQERLLWRRADELGLPRFIFINKLDRARSSFDRTLREVREVFGSHTDPVELPIGEQSTFHGIADLIAERSLLYDGGQAEDGPVPEDLEDRERAEHEHLIEEVVEFDDGTLERYLEGTDPSPAEIDRLLHDAVDAGRVFPVLCGSATAPIGADYLADFICRVGPSARPTTVNAGDSTIDIAPDPDGEPLAFVFKTIFDDFLGQLSLVKVLSGRIKPGDTLVNTGNRATERIFQLTSLAGPHHSWVEEAVAGDIVAIPKLGRTSTGDTLAPNGMPVAVTPLQAPGPTYGFAIAPTKPSEEGKLIDHIRRLTTEDPTLRLYNDSRTGQTVLSGSGEMHLQVALSRLARHGVEVTVDDVAVPYRETLAGPIEVEGRHKKQTGGHGQFGVARIRFEPLPIGSGFEFESEVRGGSIPTGLIPAVQAGIEESMARGGRYGYPLVDIRAVCVDGKHHSVDSSELAFKMAGAAALRQAIDLVGVNVLEPVSEIHVAVPSDQQGPVLGDLNARRARVLSTDADRGITTIRAHVPTSEITRYAIDLRSMTGGLGNFEVEHHGYQQLDEALAERLAGV